MRKWIILLLLFPVFAMGQDIFEASETGKREIVSRLLKENASLANAVDEFGFSPLYLAASKGHVETVCTLLDYGARIDTQNARGETALHVAALNGNEKLVGLLLARGGKMLPDDRGYTPIWNAIRISDGLHQRIAEELFAHGADANESIVTETGETRYLVEVADLAKENLQILLRHGSDINSPNDDGRALVFRYIGHSVSGDARKVKAAIEEMTTLVRAGAQINVRDKDGWTPLHCAVHFHRSDLVQVLLALGADPGLKAPDGGTPLDFARKRKFTDLEKLLLAAEQ